MLRDGPGTVRPYMLARTGALVPEAAVELNEGISSGLTLGMPSFCAQSWL